MKKLALALLLLFPLTIRAEECVCPDVVVEDRAPIITPTAPVTETPGDDMTPMLKSVYKGVTSGDWLGSAAALLVVCVMVIRKFGKQIHEALPDDNPLDKLFWFFLETKPGGWLLNFLTTLTGALGTAILSGTAITWGVIKPVLMVSLTGASLWELYKDVVDFTKKKPEVAPSNEA